MALLHILFIQYERFKYSTFQWSHLDVAFGNEQIQILFDREWWGYEGWAMKHFLVDALTLYSLSV